MCIELYHDCLIFLPLVVYFWCSGHCIASWCCPSNTGSWQCHRTNPWGLHRESIWGSGRLETPSVWWASIWWDFCWGLWSPLSKQSGCPGWPLMVENDSEISTDLPRDAEKASVLRVLSWVLWNEHRQSSRRPHTLLTAWSHRWGKGNSTIGAPVWHSWELSMQGEKSLRKTQARINVSYTAQLASPQGSLGCSPWI